MVQRLADLGRMYFIGTVAKDVQRYSLFEPLRQLCCTAFKNGLVDLHARVADVAQKDKVGGDGDVQREIRLALTSMEYLFFFSRANSNWPRIHHDPLDVVPLKQGIQLIGR